MADARRAESADIRESLRHWGDSLCRALDPGTLIARNPIAHNWKAPFRAIAIREGVCWRMHDLLTQSLYLHEAKHALGARILLRSAFETIAVLMYLNRLMGAVVDGSERFFDFETKTRRLILGSKDESTNYQAINVLTMLGKADDEIPGILKHYHALSEAAHPNFEGIGLGYSTNDRKTLVTSFENRWHDLYGANHLIGLDASIKLFQYEYNTEFEKCFTALEDWLVTNNDALESDKRSRD